MKRSERLYLEARRCALKSVVALVCCVACVCWAVTFHLDGKGVASGLLGAGSWVAVIFWSGYTKECARLLRQAHREEGMEWEYGRR